MLQELKDLRELDQDYEQRRIEIDADRIKLRVYRVERDKLVIKLAQATVPIHLQWNFDMQKLVDLEGIKPGTQFLVIGSDLAILRYRNSPYGPCFMAVDSTVHNISGYYGWAQLIRTPEEVDNGET